MTERRFPDGVILTDRTTIETDWNCQRSRYYYKEFNGHGIVPIIEADYYQIGRDLHRDLQQVCEGADLANILAPLYERLGQATRLVEREVLTRRIGWVWAFATHWWPRLQEEWEVVQVEFEIVLDRFPLWVNVIPDLVLRHRVHGHLAYYEWKSVGMLTKEWVNYWPRAIQVHIGMMAIAEELGEEVKTGKVVGLTKGREYRGRLSHPFIYGYTNDDGRWFTEHAHGRHPTGVWEYPEGPVEYLKLLSAEKCLDQFPTSAPIGLNARLVEECCQQRLLREQAIRAGGSLDALFPMSFSRCRPVIGGVCPYLEACHNATVNADPLGSGLYKPREPHHELEVLLITEGEEDDD